MKIKRALFAPGRSAFFFDDQRAIKQGAEHDGFVYRGKVVTEGFRSIREAGESISVLLELEDGQVAVGDCAAVQYSGAGGRDPLFRAESYVPFLEKHLRPWLEGRGVCSFRELAAEAEAIRIEGERLHTAIRYGLSQALLEARALSEKKLKCEVLCEEYELPVIPERIPLFGQSGDDRYLNADKMIRKHVDVLPHGLINNVDEKLGHQGEKLREYIRWLVTRIQDLRLDAEYHPDLHLDVYGTIGILFSSDLAKVTEYIASLEADAGGLSLYIEGPVDMEGRSLQIEALQEICSGLREQGSGVRIVADEWCNTLEDIRLFVDQGACDMAQIKTPDLGGIQNTVEAVLYCKARGIGAYQGGTCNETDISSRACVHAALAARADRLLAKPGMGFDEGFSVVNNEMERALAILRCRNT